MNYESAHDITYFMSDACEGKVGKDIPHTEALSWIHMDKYVQFTRIDIYLSLICTHRPT